MFGKKVKLFVADAKYRALGLTWGRYNVSYALNPHRTGNQHYINGTADNKDAPLSYNKSDSEVALLTAIAALKDAPSAKDATDILMKYSETEAAHHCRQQYIAGVGSLDLPNLYELVILYLEADNIDALDPTAQSYPDQMLGYKASSGRFYDTNRYYWSSAEYSETSAWGIGYNGYINTENWNSTAGTHGGKASLAGVAPVKELSIS